MSEFTSPLSAALPPIPDNQSIPQFFLDLRSPYQPLRPDNVPWLINDYTGQGVGHYEVSFHFHVHQIHPYEYLEKSSLGVQMQLLKR